MKSGKQNQTLHSGKLTRQAGKSSIFMREIHFRLKEHFIVRVGSHLLDRFFQGDDLHLGFPLSHFCHLFSLEEVLGRLFGRFSGFFFCFWTFVFFFWHSVYLLFLDKVLESAKAVFGLGDG